jgi:hypothetical protein
MKNLFKKQNTLLIVLFALLLFSCKKEKETNDPNIIDKDINITLSNNYPTSVTQDERGDAVDLNNDGEYDLYFHTFKEEIDEIVDSFFNGMVINIDRGGLLTQGIDFYYDPMFKTVASGTTISNSMVTWNASGLAYAKIFTPSRIISEAGTETGDQYLPMRITFGTSTHLGWISYNTSSDKKSFTIKSVAYHKTPNTEIKAGAK